MVTQPAGTPAVPTPVRATGVPLPNRLYILAPGFSHRQCELLAQRAAAIARALTPKLSGRGAAGIKPYYGAGYFGLRWDRSYIWYQERGTNPFTMHKLAGKTIPMWIDDPTGVERRKYPKAKTRITLNGRVQVLIFRKAAAHGARKRVAVRDRQGRLVRWREAPKSFPGAPGRIARTTYREEYGKVGKHTGKIAKLVPRPHVGVRWRHPGLVEREFLAHSLQQTAASVGIADNTLHAEHRRH